MIRKKLNTALQIWRDHSGLKGKIFALNIIALRGFRDILRAIESRLYRVSPANDSRANDEDASDKDIAYNWLDNPVGVANLAALKHRLTPLRIRVVSSEKPRLNVLLPALDPKIIFGGYIAALNFIKRLAITGYAVRILICEDTHLTARDIRSACANTPLAHDTLDLVELEVIKDKNTPISTNGRDVYFAYSWLTARLAHSAAKQTNNRPFIFFIQELEAIFHPHDSYHALCMETYALPHYAIFNSALLKKYFQTNKIGVFQDSGEAGLANSTHFSHALSNVMCPTPREMAARTKKRLLFYARPEAHAARNLFEVGMLALRSAIEEHIFNEQWEFYGIGSIALRGDLTLPQGHRLKMLKRVSLDEYCRMLGGFDLGLSLMYAPHPSVPPLEMAAAGLVTVTTVFNNRSADDMHAISGNLIAARPGPQGVTRGLKDAVARVHDYDSRAANAAFNWPRSWDMVFDREFVNTIQGALP